MFWAVIATVLAAQPGMPPVDAGVADVNMLGISQRRMPLDFRKPLGFDQVFQMKDGRFARGSGALMAVFPRSRYATLRNGRTLVMVPADTRFEIGTRTEDAAPRPPMVRSASAANTASQTGIARAADRAVPRRRATEAGVSSAAGLPATPTTVDQSESARAARVAALLAAAAAAE